MKKIIIAAVVTLSLAACGGNSNPDRIEQNADSVMPTQPDAPMNSDTTQRMNTDTGQMHQNPEYHPDTLLRK
jgi:uncharacterized lipoprotein